MMNGNQVFGSLVVAANIVTLGLGHASSNVTITNKLTAVRIGNSVFTANTTIGKALVWLAYKLQTVSAQDRPRQATLLERIPQSLSVGHTPQEKLSFAGKVSSETYSAITNFNYIVANNFAEMTSPDVDWTLNRNLRPNDAAYIKHMWAMLQFNEIAAAEGWEIAGSVMDVLSVVNGTSFAGLVLSSYKERTCGVVAPFPNQTGVASKQPIPILPIPSLPLPPRCARTFSPTAFPAPTVRPEAHQSQTSPPSEEVSAEAAEAVCHMPQPAEPPLLCQKDINAVEVVGYSKFHGTPLIILEQRSSSVTFQLQPQAWNFSSSSSSRGQVYVQYFDSSVHGYICVNVCNQERTFSITAHCMKSVPIAIIEIWVETDNVYDGAKISPCCFRHSGESSVVTPKQQQKQKHFLEGTYQLRCTSRCGLGE